MAQLFEDEKVYPDNAPRKNFVFLGYPFAPPLPQDDYRAATGELQQDLPVRLWYFLDEITTQELMRKIWRAVLRCDLAFFDVSGGNPNVAFELGTAVAINRPCITLLRTGHPNPLGGADLSYAERKEYTSRETLKAALREVLTSKCTALRELREVSYAIQSDLFPYDRAEIEARLIRTVTSVFNAKRTTRARVAEIFGNEDQASVVTNALRAKAIFKLEGQRRAAKWLLGDSWVHHDHEVVGGA